MTKSVPALAIILGILCASVCIAVADPLQPGEALNYTTTVTTIWKPPNDPFNPLSEAEYAKLPPRREVMSYTFAVMVGGPDADGSAQARIVLPPSGPLPGQNLEATITPDGQIVPKVDFVAIQAEGVDRNNPGAMIPAGYRSWTQAEQTNFWAYVADRRLLLFNEVALGAGKKKAFKAGDAWRIVIPDQDNQVIDFVFQGMQQFNGRDVAAINLTTTRMTHKGVGPVTGTALYDLQHHLLVNLHTDGDDDTTVGVRRQVVDIVLQQ